MQYVRFELTWSYAYEYSNIPWLKHVYAMHMDSAGPLVFVGPTYEKGLAPSGFQFP